MALYVWILESDDVTCKPRMQTSRLLSPTILSPCLFTKRGVTSQTHGKQQGKVKASSWLDLPAADRKRNPVEIESRFGSVVKIVFARIKSCFIFSETCGDGSGVQIPGIAKKPRNPNRIVFFND